MPRTKQVNTVVAIQDDWKSIVKKSIYTGVIAGVGSYLLFNEAGQSEIFNVTMSSAGVVGVAAAGGSIASDLLSDYVINSMDQSQGVRMAEGTAVKLGISGASTVLALKLGANVDPSLNGFLIGGGSKAGGDWLQAQVDPLQVLF